MEPKEPTVRAQIVVAKLDDTTPSQQHAETTHCPATRPDQQAPPQEALFYGLINESIEQLICEGFGRDKWHAVKAAAGLSDVEDGDFLQSQQYDQGVTYRLVGGISEVLGLTTEAALEAAGDSFVSKYLMRNGYLDLLRSQGKSLREFLDNMDTMHAYLQREVMPGLAPPSFKTEDAADGEGFMLHYWSFRPGLGPLVQGMVGACGRVLFSEETELRVLRSSEAGGHYYIMFHVYSSTGPCQEQANDDVGAPVSREMSSLRNIGSSFYSEAGSEAEGVKRSTKKWKKAPSSPQSQSSVPRLSSVAQRGTFKFKSWLTGAKSASEPASPGQFGLRRLRSEKNVPWSQSGSAEDLQSRGGRKPVSLVHSSEVSALVYMLRESVAGIKSEADVGRFTERFDVDQLCGLLRVRGDTGVQALVSIFREPVKAAGGTLRPPHHAFLARRMLVAEQPTAMLHRGITSRLTDSHGCKRVDPFNPPLADQHRIHGVLGLGRAHTLQRIELKVCVLPDILQFKVLKSVARSKTAALFKTPECEALLVAAWKKVRFRYTLDCALEVFLNGVLCAWTERMRAGETDQFGLVFFTLLLAKEVVEEVWSLRAHALDQRLGDFVSWDRLGGWLRVGLAAAFCYMHREGFAVDTQRPVLAGVVILQWFQMLFMCRAFTLLGPKLLPIMYTLKAMGPFLIVLVFYVGAFLHAYWALSTRPLGEVLTIGYRLGIMGDFVLEPSDASILEDHDMDPWLLAWFFVCTSLLTLFMMNVVIGVLGESYDVEHDRAHVSFLRSRAGICAEYSARMWKVQRPIALYGPLRYALHKAQDSTVSCLMWLIATAPVAVCYGLVRCVFAEWHCYDYHGRHADQDTVAPYLWMCVATDVAEEEEEKNQDAGRMHIMTSRIENSMQQMHRKAEQAHVQADTKRGSESARVEQLLVQLMDKVSLLGDRMDRQEKVLQQLHGGRAGTCTPDQAQSAAVPLELKCPFSGVVIKPGPSVCAEGQTPNAGETRVRHSNENGNSRRGEPKVDESLEQGGTEQSQPARPDGGVPPGEALFYGLVNECIEQLICEGFGRDKWHAVKAAAGLSDVEDGDFLQSQQYDQGVTYRLVGGISEVLGLTTEAALEAAGEHFVSQYLMRNGYLDLLRSQGKSLREFLDNMDTMHAYLQREVMPGLAPPSFKTEDAADGEGFMLHYWSFRPGLGPLVQGMVGACGRVLFSEETELRVLRSSEDKGVHYVKFRIGKPGEGVTIGSIPSVTDSGVTDGGCIADEAEECVSEQPARPDRQVPPGEALFYGLVNECIEQLICEGFGRDKWHAVKAAAGLSDVEDGDFLQSQQYDQGVTYRLVGGISEVLGLTTEAALEAAGEHFVSQYLMRNGYLDLLRSQGKSLREFLDNMDTMHAYLQREVMPGLAPPSFKTEDAADGEGFMLHYWSFRPGLGPLVQGMVGACGRVLFSEETELRVLRSSEAGGHYYVLFRVS